jgi:hypothetical protein
MATKFIKGQVVKVQATDPQGPVQALRMTEDGDFFYHIEWTDADGVLQNRWFPEAALTEA